ncbi:hypothetical protein L6164_025828 [Bauhinia variegata]|uniref:Uncharacterized protein n=1 Tax=Bauhinia variegata TaxID=167791 RepID=A0ACB9M4R3_BAUVA|nr:hypothetical protein L6164_025828 [Bauhinia variegata]
MAKSYYSVYLLSLLSFLVAQFPVGDTPIFGGNMLKIGVPIKSSTFHEFVNVKWNCTEQNIQKIGYPVDNFRAIIANFLDIVGKITAGSYFQSQLIPGKVGDVTIDLNGIAFVGFTKPFSDELGVKMLVQVQRDDHINMWIFLQPFSWDLWLSIILFCFFIGVIILVMESKANKETQTEDSLGRKQLTRASVLWLPLAQAVLPQRESVVNKSSRFVLLVWLGLAFILIQSYTTSLYSILTSHQQKPSYPSLDTLKRNQENVGYREGSIVRKLLIDHLKFDESRLRRYSTIEQYHDALQNGTRSGGVAAIFDHAPYINVFLEEYGSKFMMAGPTYRISGFGLGLTDKIEEKYVGINHDDLQDQYDQIFADTPSLTTQSFAGLFMITGSLILLALLVSECCICQRPLMMLKNFSQRSLFSSFTKKSNQSKDGSKGGTDAGSKNEGSNHRKCLQRSLSMPV